jgi:hypothetical protein
MVGDAADLVRAAWSGDPRRPLEGDGQPAEARHNRGTPARGPAAVRT